MSADLLHGFYLGDLFVEPLKGQVSSGTGTRHIPPKAAEVLVCLARESGDVVSHEKLLQCAWGTDQGSPEALSRAVSEIRTALDDHADDPAYIQTLPRVGYRLVVQPELHNEETASVVLGAQGGLSVEDIGLFENLRRRGVLETALAYMILGWLLIQVAATIFPQLHLPEWASTFVTVLIILGFPIALVLSWFLDWRDGHAMIDTVSPTRDRRRRFSRTYMSVVGSLVIAGIMVTIYQLAIGLPVQKPVASEEIAHVPEPPPILENSLAVLPFANIDGSRETKIFADGLVEGVIDQLSRVPGLRVASRGDSYTLEPNTASQTVRDRLRVGLYIEGSVEMNADEIRATVQLINSEDGFHLLSRRFDRPIEEFFDLRDEVADLIVANVRVSLPPNLQPTRSQPTERPSLNTYVLYRQGIEALRQPTTIDTVASALGWFDAALTLDQGYAVAHAAKCEAYIQGYREMDDDSYIERAQLSCAAGLALNPALDVVQTSLGDLHVATGRYFDAETAYQAALDFDPADDKALRGLGLVYQRLNRPDDAVALLRKAVDIHPGNASLYNWLGNLLFEQGRFSQAEREYGYAVALMPQNMKHLSNLASAYSMQGKFSRAASFYQQAIDIRPTSTTHSNLGIMRFYTGDYEAAIENLTTAVELSPNDYFIRVNLGDTLLAAGSEEEAWAAFAKADKLATRALAVNNNDPYIVMDLAWIKSGLGEHDEARRQIDRAIEMAPNDPYMRYYSGLIFNRAGSYSQALVELKSAANNGYPIAMLAGDPNIDNLKGDSRFHDITESPREER